MRNLKVAVRLGLAFGLLLLLMMVAVGVGFLGIRGAEAQANRLERESIAILNAANAMRVAQANEAVAIRDFVSLSDVESQRVAQQLLKDSEKAYGEAFGQLEALVAGDEMDAALRALVAKLKGVGKETSAKLHQAMDLSDMAEYQEAQAVVFKQVRPLQAAVAADLQALVVAANGEARQRAEAARAEARRMERQLLAVMLVALALGIGATVLITIGIVRPLRSAVHAAERVAGGDLTHLQATVSRDEAGRVLGALAGMQQGLNTLVRAIRESAEAVNTASEQISASNSELAARTEEQASSLEETAASVEELTATVKQNTEGAGKASALARQAAQLAADGGEAVAGVVGTMEGIQKSSRQVSEIIGVMDEIAFQTNLLALNAAVEAARAGDHGRGFAVVAAQVRVLAQRSAEASKDIKKLVAAAVTEANQGARAAAQAGQSMEKVVRAARDAATLVTEIARASEEQRSGIEQVNTSIAHMDTVTQNNAALVQEINNTIEVLLGQARDLLAAASRFRLEQGERPAEAAVEASNPALPLWDEPVRALS